MMSKCHIPLFFHVTSKCYLPTADPGVMSSILARSHTFIEIDLYGPFPSSTDSRMIFVIYKRKYGHKVLVSCLVKLAQEKSVVR